MNTRQFVSCLFLSVLCLALAISKGNAQTSDSNGSVANRPQRPKIELPVSTNDERVAGRSAVFCAGYVRNQKFGSMPELVGALEEQEKHTFSTGDVVYISWGSTEGIKEGQEFQIIRPRGEVKNVHQNKKGSLGVYVEEVGQLQVLNVREHTSSARITFSCDSALLGDFLTTVPNREAPLVKAGTGLDLYSVPTGKQTGRLVMGHDGREMMSKSDIVYIDLGAEDRVTPGDYLTIFRPLGTGNLKPELVEEGARGRLDGFQSEVYRGGGFGVQAQRTKDQSGVEGSDGHFSGNPITSKEIKKHRATMPRKIVGEMVIIDVQARTATAVITQTAGEVHTGDWVEVK